MEHFIWIIIGAVALLAVPVAVVPILTAPLAKGIYKSLLVRETPDKWKRVNSCPSDLEYSSMYDQACAWGERYKEQTSDVTIMNEGLRLCGRFTDFGSERTVLILCGRAEGLFYSYYYAEPYRRQGYNVLVVDQRAHGESEGIYSGLGVHEARDAVAWMRFLKESCHTTHIVLHGLCIGAACTVYAAALSDCPKELRGIVTDGLYDSFHHVFLQRMKTMKKPIFPVLYQIEREIRKHTGICIRKQTPASVAPLVKVPLLMLHGKEDISSLPKFVPSLYEKMGSSQKKLVWLPKGAHSHLRICNTEAYDAAVEAFLQTL